jgi:hypothetical protein
MLKVFLTQKSTMWIISAMKIWKLTVMCPRNYCSTYYRNNCVQHSLLSAEHFCFPYGKCQIQFSASGTGRSISLFSSLLAQQFRIICKEGPESFLHHPPCFVFERSPDLGTYFGCPDWSFLWPTKCLEAKDEAIVLPQFRLRSLPWTLIFFHSLYRLALLSYSWVLQLWRRV